MVRFRLHCVNERKKRVWSGGLIKIGAGMKAHVYAPGDNFRDSISGSFPYRTGVPNPGVWSAGVMRAKPPDHTPGLGTRRESLFRSDGPPCRRIGTGNFRASGGGGRRLCTGSAQFQSLGGRGARPGFPRYLQCAPPARATANTAHAVGGSPPREATPQRRVRYLQ